MIQSLELWVVRIWIGSIMEMNGKYRHWKNVECGEYGLITISLSLTSDFANRLTGTICKYFAFKTILHKMCPPYALLIGISNQQSAINHLIWYANQCMHVQCATIPFWGLYRFLLFFIRFKPIDVSFNDMFIGSVMTKSKSSI